MKVALGVRRREGPWGGGNQFANAIADFLQDRGVTVERDLSARDLDLILLTEPRRASASSAFNDVDILRYLAVNPRALVVHRINECDERKGTKHVNRRLELANGCADATVFISEWLADLFARRGRPFADVHVIRNGGDPHVFKPSGVVWDGREPLRVVTHHWSDHWMKGFDVYRHFDEMLGQETFAKQFRFTYIGKLPVGFSFRHTDVLAPRHGTALGAALAGHHVYLTASQNEPAGMHHIEGALCGLPILYRMSGALPEYCDRFGVGFDAATFEAALTKMRGCYGALKARMSEYPYTADRMCESYLTLFQDLLSRRDAVVAGRACGAGANRVLRTRAALYDSYVRWRTRLRPPRPPFSEGDMR